MFVAFDWFRILMHNHLLLHTLHVHDSRVSTASYIEAVLGDTKVCNESRMVSYFHLHFVTDKCSRFLVEAVAEINTSPSSPVPEKF